MIALLRRWTKLKQSHIPQNNPRRTRLRVEQMEDRCTPANLNLTVNTLNDVVDANDGVLSLREAISQSNANVPNTFNTIEFASNLSGGTITLDDGEGELLVTENVIIGPSSSMSNITVQRDSTSAVKHRIFHVTSGAILELDRLNLYNGELTTGSGGAVLVEDSTLVLHDCYVNDNSAYHGGGIAVTGSSSLQIFDSDISSNSATENGGGIYVVGSSAQVSIHDSTIKLNVSGFNGGGMYTTAGTNTLDNVEVAYNETQSKGGGIYAAPGGMNGSISISNGSNIHHNECVNPTTSERKGGGIYLGAGTIDLDTITIANNEATTGDGLYLASGTDKSEIDVTWTNDTE